MILAAGRGERMRPLTDDVPKPLLKAGGRHLIEYHIEALVGAGFHDLVINHAHLGDQIEQALGDGAKYGAQIVYSPEGEQGLETGGGIRHALSLLGDQPFVVVNADVWTDFPLRSLRMSPAGHAHLVLVDNPDHNPRGDFVLENGRVLRDGAAKLTFSGLAVYRPELFAACTERRFPLAPLLRREMDRGQVSGAHHRGRWLDVGTPQRLQELDTLLGSCPD